MYNIGVDLGGTNIAAGVVDETGQILLKSSISTRPERDYHEIIHDMAVLIYGLIDEGGYKLADIASIGIGCPGAVDKKRGKVIFASNLFWYHVPIQALLQDYLNLPVYLENDATVAGSAEYLFGACQGTENAITLTLGTGVGSGMILNGQLYSGSHGAGAHLGHMIVELDGIPCACGNKGCWEQYVSATALVREGQKAVKESPESLIANLAGHDFRKVTAKMVLDAAKEKDPAAVMIFERYIRYLAMGMITIINAFDPEVIAIGGGVSHAGDFLLQPLCEEVEKHIIYKDVAHARICLAQLGNDAGIIGAAMLGRINR